MHNGLAFHVYDVFTDRIYAGNPLAIVEEAGALSTAQMQAMARQFNLSETIFVMPPRDPAHTARVRIFFPTAEIPFAGHPTLGCALHLAALQAGGGAATGGEIEIVLEEEAGRVPVRVWQDGESRIGQFTAPVLPERMAWDRPVTDVAAALGLSPDEIGLPGHKPALRKGGPSFLYVPVASLEALGRAAPHAPAWGAVVDVDGNDAAYLYTPDPDRPGGYRARMFAPRGGIPEDPATGSASAIFAGQLMDAGALGEGVTAVPLRQGVEMGRPSDIGLEADVAGGRLVAVRVSGRAVKVAEGRIEPPPT